MKSVRLGIVGVGGMGGNHARMVLDGSIRDCRLAAVCDSDPAVLNRFPSVDHFIHSEELIRSGRVDALLIATPHYTHTTIGIDALEQGLHVLVEKPISVHKADCLRLIGAHHSENQIFAAMFNQRTLPHFRHARSLIQNGEVGGLFRVHWTITTWFRSQLYFDSGDWRATWAGEGGGLLLNQCPHQLDLLWWLCGMPERIRAFCSFGKRHSIEVEDEVFAYLEYPGEANGLFYASTGELPGTDRLEIVGDKATIVIEGNTAYFDRLEVPTREYINTSKERFGKPAYRRIPFPEQGEGGRHKEIIQNFVDAILDGSPLIAPAGEGIHSVELANAMLYSSLIDRPVEIPMDAQAYEQQLSDLISASKSHGTDGGPR